MAFKQLVPAEVGWKAVFTELDGSETMSRIVAWASVDDGDGDSSAVVGLIVDPSEPSAIVSAPGTSSPGGGDFLRYRFVAPDPMKVVVEQPPPPPTDTAEVVAKKLIKRGR
jgi:hypothetical protein